MTNPRGRKSQSRTERRRNATARRRQRARRLTRVDPRRRRRQMLLRVGLGVVVVALAAGAIFVLVNRDSGGSTAADVNLTSPVVDDEQDLTITSPPSTYHVIYRLEANGGEEAPTISTEEFSIQRPFNGKVTGKDGEPPGTTDQFAAISNLGMYSSSSAGADPTVGKSLPSAALGDFRLDATLPDLVANGSFVPRERREVLGRECQVYRTGQALETFQVAAPTDTAYSDVCIDASGLLLEEVTVSDGAAQQRLIATAVDNPYTVPDGAFTITGTPVTLDAGGSELNPVDPATAPVPGYWTLDAPPDGYTLQGRYMLRQQAAPADADPDPTATTTTSVAPTIQETYVDVYVNGTNAIVIQQGPSAAGPQTPLTGATTATVGSLGSAQVASGLTGSTILAKPATPADWFVQLTGTVPAATLTTVATAMHG